ncbi:AraC family transcriptional regulator [Dyadobacter sp. 3J3]|uniref:AraC family transcriptional regulator n=1 Tax=Dyadobacter sp. 3J3 TaxID=2606600 RepID=UPI00190F39FE|nr:AraC family transcriptional regulator [Dyadobacter sp. 3J3]
MPDTIQKSRGFEGELIIEIPKIALTQSENLPLIQALHIARMGFYPKALHHYYQRPSGISQVILLYCTAGKGWVHFNKKRISIEPGEVFLIPTDMPHSYGSDEENPWTIYWFHITGSHCDDAFSTIMGDIEKLSKGIRVGFSSERNEIFKQMSSIFLRGYSASNLLLANLLLPHYLATFISPEFFQTIAQTTKELSATDKAISFMQQNLTRTVTLDNIAQSANLSVSFFSRKFKQETGYAPVEYFNYLRIQKACQLLHFSSLRINEVALQIGMEDPFYFSRLFKQQMGLSPVAYRKSGRQGVDPVSTNALTE